MSSEIADLKKQLAEEKEKRLDAKDDAGKMRLALAEARMQLQTEKEFNEKLQEALARASEELSNAWKSSASTDPNYFPNVRLFDAGRIYRAIKILETGALK